MVHNAGGSKVLLISSSPMNGLLHIQNTNYRMSSWEFYVGRRVELIKLPHYPDTRVTCPHGIAVTLKYRGHQCTAAFHGFYTPNAKPEYIFIGSARRLLGVASTHSYRAFLMNFGVNVGVQTNPIPIKLDFQAGNVVYVS